MSSTANIIFKIFAKLKQKYFSHFQWRGAKSFVQKHSQNCYVQWSDCWLLPFDRQVNNNKNIKRLKQKKIMCVCVWVYFNVPQSDYLITWNHAISSVWKHERNEERKEKQHKRWKFSNKLFPIDIFSFLWAFVFPLFLLLHFSLSLTLFPFFMKSSGKNFMFEHLLVGSLAYEVDSNL